MRTQKTHFACAAIFRRTGGGGVETLILESVTRNSRTGRLGKPKLKFPGGMQKDPGERPLVTMMREVLEEAGLRVHGAELVYSAPSPRAGWRIIQYGYLVEFGDCTGHLRDKKLMFDKHSTLSPLKWVNILIIKRGGLAPTHQRIFDAAIKRLWRP